MHESTSGSYPCRAVGCTAQIQFPFLMCKPHWRMVPKHQQRAIWNAKRAIEQEAPNCYSRYRLAIIAAVDTVAEREEKMEAKV